MDLHQIRLTTAPYVHYLPTPDQHLRTVNVNASGMRGPEVAAKPAKVVRVLVSGGSFVFGYGATGDDRTVAAELQRLLRAELAGREIEVINVGVPGFVVTQQLVDLETRGLALDPDLIVFIDGLNDIEAAALGRAGRPLIDMDVTWRTRLIEWTLSSSLAERSLSFAREMRGPVPLSPGGAGTPEDLAAATANRLEGSVRDAAAISASRGVAFAHFVQPTFFGGNKPRSSEEEELSRRLEGCGDLAVSMCRTGLASYMRYAARQLGRASQRLAASGVESHDLSGIFDGESATLWVDEAHLADAGYARVAAAMLPTVRALLSSR